MLVLLLFTIQPQLVLPWNLKFLSSYQPFPDPPLPISGKDLILPLKKMHLEDIANRWKYPVLPNLNTYLGKLSTELSSFIIVDNFQVINLIQPVTPIVLRNPVPIIYRIPSFWQVAYQLEFAASKVSLENVSFSHLTAHSTCPSSKYFEWVDSYTHLNPCLQINLSTFIWKIKQFSSTIHNMIFPPDYVSPTKPQLIYPKTFSWNFKHLPFYISTPSFTFPINGMVQFKEQQNRSFLGWIQRRQHSLLQSFKYIHEVFVTFLVSAPDKRNYGSNSWQESSGNIEASHILKICPECLLMNGWDFGTIISTEIESFHRNNLEKLAFTWPHGNLWCNFFYPSRHGSLLHTVINFLSHLDLTSDRRFLSSQFGTEPSKTIQKVALAHSEVWYNILKNFTIIKSDASGSRTLNFFITMSPGPYASSLLTFPHYPKDDLSRLRIVGCGRKGLASLSFQELTCVFDNIVWLGILSSLISIPLVMKMLRKNTNIIDGIISVSKIFLEQNDPFPPSIRKLDRTRVLVGLLLLTGIILSNAYKNTNVYNMVIPRKPIIFKYLNELVQSGFNIYTRIEYIDVMFRNTDNNVIIDLHDNYVEHTQNFTYALMTEVKSLAKDYKPNVLIRELLREEHRTDKTLVDTGLLDRTRLHPMIVRLFGKLTNDMTPTYEYFWSEAERIRDRIQETLRSEEKLKLEESLEECQKSAVIMPDYISKDVFKRLVMKRKIAHVFIGEELFSDIDWIYTIQGIIPPNIIRRVHRIGESGVWHWWMDLFEGIKFVNENADHVEPASMTGNIVVVFSVWALGIGLSGMFIFLEFVNVILQRKFASLSVPPIKTIDISVIQRLSTSRPGIGEIAQKVKF